MKTVLFILLIGLTIFQSCNKKDNGGTFTLKGACLKDCSKVPIANQKISVILTKYENFNSKEKWIAGEGTTDANGNFSIVCENRGNCEVVLEGFRNYTVTEIPGGKDEVYDMGEIYATYTQVCNLKVIFQTPHSDTFYIGTSTTPFGMIPNANGTKFVKLTKSEVDIKAYLPDDGSFSYKGSLRYRYGFSYQGYYDNLINTNASFVNHAFDACENSDTVSITIP